MSSNEAIKHLKEYFRYYNKPRRIISDRGTFTSNEFKDFLKKEYVDHILIAIGYLTLRANGQVERLNAYRLIES